MKQRGTASKLWLRLQAKHHNETVPVRATMASMRRGEAAAQTAARSSDRLARARLARCEVVEHIRGKAVMVSHYGRSMPSTLHKHASARSRHPNMGEAPRLVHVLLNSSLRVCWQML